MESPTLALRAGTLAETLAETRVAFDGVASSYDRSNTGNAAICAFRERTLAALTSRLPVGSHLLDLGCGPGADAERLARCGYTVTAIDWSPAMVREAERRLARARLASRPSGVPGASRCPQGAGVPVVDVRLLGIHELDRLDAGPFDGAYSNLGPLNCVPDLPWVARQVATRLRPMGLFVASVIGRICPWEIALFVRRRDWDRLSVRFSRGFVPVPLEGRTVWTRYHSPSAFESAFVTAGFRRVALRALGLWTPPPYMQAFSGRHPALMRWLQCADDRTGSLPGLRNWGDHFLIVMRRT
jgi:SAM-dependent methyltransferase